MRTKSKIILGGIALLIAVNAVLIVEQKIKGGSMPWQHSKPVTVIAQASNDEIAEFGAGLASGRSFAREEMAAGALKKTDSAIEGAARSAGDDPKFQRAFIRGYAEEWARQH